MTRLVVVTSPYSKDVGLLAELWQIPKCFCMVILRKWAVLKGLGYRLACKFGPVEVQVQGCGSSGVGHGTDASGGAPSQVYCGCCVQ